MKTLLCLAALLALVFMTMAGAARAQGTVTFQDGTFNNADWTVSVEVLNLGGSVTATQIATGGAPGAFRRITNSMNSALGFGFSNTVYGAHFRAGAVYDPATTGAVLSIAYSEDSQRNSSVGGVQACGLALRQNGTIYYGPLFLTPTTVGVWATNTQATLVAAQFDAIAPGLQTPDFSPTGAPIEFGFVRGNSTSVGGSGGQTIGGIDDWSVIVTHEAPVATHPSTWGKVKALFRD